MKLRAISPKTAGSTSKAASAAALWGIVLLMGCAANRNQPVTLLSTAPLPAASTAPAAKIIFHHTNFNSLMSPSTATGCAGDAKTIHQALALKPSPVPSISPVPATFEANSADPNQTLKPAFIRNISVDMTDASAPMPSNLAQSCSLGTQGPVPPTSACATFDYGAITGVPSTLGGSLMIVGGIRGNNYANTAGGASLSCGPVGTSTDINRCDTAIYALGVETLGPDVPVTSSGVINPLTPGLPGTSAQSARISSWANLASQSANQPSGVAGAAIGMSTDLAKVILFGGTSPLGSVDGSSPGIDTANVWTFDLTKQIWTKQQPLIYIEPDVYQMTDYVTNSGPPRIEKWTRAIGARALHAMLSVPGLGLQKLTTNGLLYTPGTFYNLDAIDISERILVIGGYDNSGLANPYTMKMNPTFGPERIDMLGLNNGNYESQYLESHFIQYMNSSTRRTQLGPDIYTESFINTGIAPVLNVASSGGQLAPVGSAVLLGGFNNYFKNLRTINPSPSPSPVALRVMARETQLGWNYLMSQLEAVPNDLRGNKARGVQWVVNAMPSPAPTPYGGAVLLPGFELASQDLVYFGGSTCRDYLGDSSLQFPPCDFANPGQYVRMLEGGTLPVPFDAGATQPTPSPIPMAGIGPRAAGMSAARGVDEFGNTIIVAWGGMTDATLPATPSTLYVLYNASTTVGSPAPTWRSVAVSDPVPTTLTNASMVFSHVTGKFYVFGGVAIKNGTFTMGDTWELSVAGNCTAATSCTFSWRKLNKLADGGRLTCAPDCPTGRRSHKMVETNYAYQTLGSNKNVDVNLASATFGEPQCTNSSSPCSFGIFMNGGTSDGYQLIDEWWMFDPTANGGNGHWQLVGHLPPRHLSQMAVVDHYIYQANKRFRRAVVFGGQTAMADPNQIAPFGSSALQQYFVPPTLGDTWIYDLDQNRWHKPKLLGKGYDNSALSNVNSNYGPFEATQAYDAQNLGSAGNHAEMSALSPPALAGGVMVTRTQPGPVIPSAAPSPSLAIPQVFLFGGRTKDGQLLDLTKVYKFCMGSAGERTAVDSTECDDYDPVKNNTSGGATSDYVGRWLLKTTSAVSASVNVPPSTGEVFGSYMGAGTYDSVRDRIILAGGVTSTNAVTNSSARKILGASSTEFGVFEYTPPSRTALVPVGTIPAATSAERNGSWTYIGACSSGAIPVGRYGHSLAYDAANLQLIMTGGYKLDGTALTQTQTLQTNTSRQYVIPEVWTGKYDPTNNCYVWSQKSVFGNTIDVAAQAPPMDGLSHSAAIMIPPQGYSTGYYSLLDNACKNANPILLDDPEMSKENAGGAYIDLDRSALGPNENLLLNLSFIPLGASNLRPDGLQLSNKEAAVIEIHLVRTRQDQNTLQSAQQPRYVRYADQLTLFPEVVQKLAVLSPPTGEMRQEQVIIPLASDPSIDRIRIQRRSGSAILIDASIYRMGYR